MGRDLGHYRALFIAIAVMALLSGVLLLVVGVFTVGLGGVGYFTVSAGGHAKVRTAEIEAYSALERVQVFHLRNGEWPASLGQAYSPEPVPVDPWGHPYELVVRGSAPVIRSLGPDGYPGLDDIEAR